MPLPTGSGFVGWIQNEAVSIAVEASNPFFSPDGKWVGFFGTTSVLKVPVDGGDATSIARTTDRPAGAAWRADGAIVFATTEGLYQVSDAGGEAKLLIRPDRQKRERLYAWPQFTPDGQSVLFTILSEDSRALPQIVVPDMRNRQHRIILSGGTGARYVPTGHLVYASGAALKAIAFDPATGQVHGGPVSLSGIEVATAPDNGARISRFPRRERSSSRLSAHQASSPAISLCGRCSGSIGTGRRSRWRFSLGLSDTRACRRMELAWPWI